MMNSKKKVFLTGASGNMGQATLNELLEKEDQFEITAFALPTKKDRQILAPYQKRD